MQTLSDINYGRNTILEVNLENTKHNLLTIKKKLAPLNIMAVVKANAYGLGATTIAKSVLEAGAIYLGVAILEEALELRADGIDAPILILGDLPANVNVIKTAIRANITMTVSSLSSLTAIIKAAKDEQCPANIHLKIDTGMGRLGLQPENLEIIREYLLSTKEVVTEGIFTHFSSPESDLLYTTKQQQLFVQIIEQTADLKPKYLHAANSAGALLHPNYGCNMVRIGISMHGISPEKVQTVPLRPVYTWKSTILHLKYVPVDTKIGYDCTYTTPSERCIATVPVGYADGYNRLLSNRGQMLVNEQRVPVVGRISMDYTTVDVTDVMPVAIGDEVIIYGEQGNAKISLNEVAEKLQTIPYELLTSIHHRIPRVYMNDQEIVNISNSLIKKSLILS